MKITNYAILKASSIQGLARMVTDYIEYGWEPTGGVAVATEFGTPLFCQAMVTQERDAREPPLHPAQDELNRVG